MNNVINNVKIALVSGFNFVKEKFNALTPLQKKVALAAAVIFSGFITLFTCYSCLKNRKVEVVKTTPIKIESESDLKKLLDEHQIDLSKGTKTIANLFKEIKEEECTLELRGKELIRCVNVVSVRCFTELDGHRLQLIEKNQVYKKTGKVVERHLGYIGEKIKPGEKPETAAIRGIAEELQITDGVKVKAQETKVTEKKSQAYAGLNSVYSAHYFAFEINKDQYKETYQEVQPEKTSNFEWIKI